MNEPHAKIGLYSKLLSLIDILFYTVMISLVICGVSGYILSQFFDNLSIQVWSIALILSFIIVFLYLLYSSRNVYLGSEFSLRNFVLGLLPFLVLVPGFIALFLSTRVQLSVHGPFHMGYISQILNGTSPPENVVLPGFGANIYWLYHALLAVFVHLYNIAPPLALAIVNLGALIGSLYWIRKSIGLLGINDKNSFITSSYTLLILFGASLFASIHVFLINILWGNLTLQILDNPLKYEGMLFDGDIRLITLLKKYLNFNGTPVGILYFCFAVYISLLILKGELTTRKILLLAIAISGALMFHITSGLFTLLIIPLSVLVSLLIANRQKLNNYIQRTDAFNFILLVILILILYIPVLHYIYLAAKALPAETQIGTSIHYNLVSIFSTAYPILPFSFLAIYLNYRKKNDIIVFFTTAGILGFTLSILADLPGNNQYKFIFLSTIVACFLSVIGLDYIYYDLKGEKRLAGKFIFYITFILLAVNILSTGYRYLDSTSYRDKSYYAQDRNVLTRDRSYMYKDVYVWIRDNTPRDAVVIMPLASKDTGGKREDEIGGYIYMIAERLPYVAKGRMFANGIPEYHKRRDNVNLFYSDETPVDKKIEILNEFQEFGRERPSILLIPKEYLKPLGPHLENLRLIYSGKDANLYSF